MSEEAGQFMFFYGCGTELLAYNPKSYGKKIYLSTDGLNFFPLQVGGYYGNSLKHELSFSNPFDNDSRGKFCFEDEVITMMTDDRIFRLVSFGEQGLRFHHFPDERQPEYLFRTLEGEYLYVSADRFKYSYESFKLFYGPAESMKHVPIIESERWRDGGTTFVVTEIGTLFSPTSFRPDEKPTWQDQEIEPLDHKDFKIQEVLDAVTLFQ